jgi:hypothetical protein
MAILLYFVSAAIVVASVWGITRCGWLCIVLAVAALFGSLGVGVCVGGAQEPTP